MCLLPGVVGSSSLLDNQPVSAALPGHASNLTPYTARLLLVLNVQEEDSLVRVLELV